MVRYIIVQLYGKLFYFSQKRTKFSSYLCRTKPVKQQIRIRVNPFEMGVVTRWKRDQSGRGQAFLPLKRDYVKHRQIKNTVCSRVNGRRFDDPKEDGVLATQ